MYPRSFLASFGGEECTVIALDRQCTGTLKLYPYQSLFAFVIHAWRQDTRQYDVKDHGLSPWRLIVFKLKTQSSLHSRTQYHISFFDLVEDTISLHSRTQYHISFDLLQSMNWKYIYICIPSSFGYRTPRAWIVVGSRANEKREPRPNESSKRNYKSSMRMPESSVRLGCEMTIERERQRIMHVIPKERWTPI